MAGLMAESLAVLLVVRKAAKSAGLMAVLWADSRVDLMAANSDGSRAGKKELLLVGLMAGPMAVLWAVRKAVRKVARLAGLMAALWADPMAD